MQNVNNVVKYVVSEQKRLILTVTEEHLKAALATVSMW